MLFLTGRHLTHFLTPDTFPWKDLVAEQRRRSRGSYEFQTSCIRSDLSMVYLPALHLVRQCSEQGKLLK